MFHNGFTCVSRGTILHKNGYGYKLNNKQM